MSEKTKTKKNQDQEEELLADLAENLDQKIDETKQARKWTNENKNYILDQMQERNVSEIQTSEYVTYIGERKKAPSIKNVIRATALEWNESNRWNLTEEDIEAFIQDVMEMKKKMTTVSVQLKRRKSKTESKSKTPKSKSKSKRKKESNGEPAPRKRKKSEPEPEPESPIPDPNAESNDMDEQEQDEFVVDSNSKTSQMFHGLPLPSLKSKSQKEVEIVPTLAELENESENPSEPETLKPMESQTDVTILSDSISELTSKIYQQNAKHFNVPMTSSE